MKNYKKILFALVCIFIFLLAYALYFMSAGPFYMMTQANTLPEHSSFRITGIILFVIATIIMVILKLKCRINPIVTNKFLFLSFVVLPISAILAFNIYCMFNINTDYKEHKEEHSIFWLLDKDLYD